MRLKAMRVQRFRCVEDSNAFRIDQVTCLVGKNESGKTTILHALEKLNPVSGKGLFVPSRDYPKRHWTPQLKIVDDPPALWTEWELSDDDLSALARTLGEGVVTSREVSLTKSYANQILVKSTSDENAYYKGRLDAAQLGGEDRKPLSGLKSVADAIAKLTGMETRSQPQEKFLQELNKNCPKGCASVVPQAIVDLLPTFLYFDEYLTLPGSVSIDDVIRRRDANELTEKDRVFFALLELAGTTIDSIHKAKTFDEFNASLRAVSIQVTNTIFKYWSQNRHLEVDARIDHARPGDPPPFNEGWVFRLRIENKRHRADTSFDERSRGFVWFFSFLVWFTQLQDVYGDNLLILLDEPGLTLHPRAQGDLLRYIHEQLEPRYQVIYTTHSPFMVDPDNLLSARTVEDVVVRPGTPTEELLGTKVNEDVLSTDADTISPLQRALDYELTQTLFVGRNTLLVEGASDLLYLKWFARQRERLGQPGLDYRWTISIIGGIDRIPGFISLFRGNGLNVAAVADVSDGVRKKVETAEQALKPGHLIRLDQIAGQRDADIEDVLGREFYRAIVNGALSLSGPYEFPAAMPVGAQTRLVKEAEYHCATLPGHLPNFNHTVPAEWLFLRGDEGAELPGFAAAMDRMGQIIDALNALV